MAKKQVAFPGETIETPGMRNAPKPPGSQARLLLLVLLWFSCGFLLPVVRAEEPLRFAWLSDTHVGSSTAAEDLRAAVRDINALPGIGFVVISGDITEYGSLEQFRLARQILGELKAPLHIIPGNHDTKWSESGGTDFASIWKADRFSFAMGGVQFIGMHQGPVMRMGDGHWAPQDIRWLETTLREVPENLPIVFITHYPVDPGIANWYEVLDRLKGRSTRVVLCGHGHANKALNFEGLPGVMGRSNLRARATVGGFNLVELDSERIQFSEHPHGGPTRAPWTSVSLEPKVFGKPGTRPDFSVNEKHPAVRRRWVWESGYTIAAGPLAQGDSCFVGDASGKITALSTASGKPRWQYQTRGPVWATPDLSGDTLVAASCDGSLYALSASTGARLWEFKTGRPVVACPRIAGEVVYVGSSENKFRALSLASGKLLWEFDGLNGFVETRSTVAEGKVIFGAWDQHLYALDAATGKLAWKWRGDRAGVLFSPAACWPAATGGRVFVVAPDRFTTAIDARTGQQLWRTNDFGGRESLGLSEDGHRLYVRSINQLVCAYDTAADQPVQLWQTDAGFGYDINSAMLVEKNGRLFYGTKSGLLLAFDGRSGTLLWQHKAGVALLNTAAPLSEREVLLSDFDGRVLLVEETN
jgi:outer membrane protein assembly factor BamB/predicted phosphodiesterase